MSSLNPPITSDQMDFLEQLIRIALKRSSNHVRMAYDVKDFDKAWDKTLDKETDRILQQGFFIMKTFLKPDPDSRILSIESSHEEEFEVKLDLLEVDRGNVAEAVETLKSCRYSKEFKKLFTDLIKELNLTRKSKK